MGPLRRYVVAAASRPVKRTTAGRFAPSRRTFVIDTPIPRRKMEVQSHSGGEGRNDVRRSVAVQIAGHKYVIKTDADEAYVDALARYVDGKIDEAKKVTKTVSTHQVVILAALNIADDLFRVEREGGELKKAVRERTKDVLKYIEQEAKASGS